MIHLHVWRGLSVGSRESSIVPFSEGMTVGDVSDGAVLHNGRRCSLDAPLRDGDHVDVMVLPGAEITLAEVLWTMLISTAISVAVRALLPPPEPAKEGGDERSPTYGFGRVRNIRAEGQPIPVIYGEHLTGGTIFNEFVEVNNSTGESTYFALVGLGHGEVESIGGATSDTPDVSPLTSNAKTTPETIFLQGNPLSNFHKTKVWVRMGSNEQTLVPGFEKSRVTYDVNVGLTTKTVGVDQTNDLIPALDYDSADYDVTVWDKYGYAWDVPQVDVDGVEAVIHFPGGLYKVDTNGTIQPTRWVLGIRYCKLDANGQALLGSGFGGNQDDGWVRLPFEEFNLDRQNSFQLTFPVSFYDPLDHIAPVPGDTYRTQSWSSASIETVNPVFQGRRPETWNPGVYGDGAIAGKFTCECWLAFDTTAADDGPFDAANITGSRDYLPIFEWASTASEDGVWFGFRVYPDGRWRPYMEVGKWGRWFEWPDVSDMIEPTTDSTDKKWHHIVWSHSRDGSSTNRTRFWLNGVYLGEYEQNVDILAPDPANGSGTGFAKMVWGESSTLITGDFSVRGWWDEMIVADDFYSNQDVALRYNGGEGIRQSDADPDLVLLWHIEGGLTDATAFGNHGVGTTGTLVTDEGKITKVVAPTRTRGAYRVQCCRINGESQENGLGNRRQDDAEWQLAVTWIDQTFVYPGIAYSAIEVEATEQVNSSAPTVTHVVRGRKVRVWDRVSTVAPSFARQWTQNPAWIAMDIATDEEYGGGQAFALEDVDLDSVAALADRCDERVYDARGQRYFYRQDYEANGNLCTSPASIDGFWSLTTGSPTVTQNAAEAPNGAIEADTIEDTDAGVTATRGFSATPSTEPSLYCASAFIKKDTSVTAHSAGIRITLNSVPYDCVFNLDDGAAIDNCVVVDYDDDWWWVKCTPQLFEGIGSIACHYLPAAFDRNTTTENSALLGEMTVWGFALHRGRAHTAYPDSEGARAYLFMANEDSDGAAQTLPSHWIAGAELRIRDAGDSSWDTPLTGTLKALEITEVVTTDAVDGYDRVWMIAVKWPSTLDAPDGTYPNLVSDGIEWNDIAGEWTVPTGVTAVQEFDDGGQTGGPVDDEPLFSDVCKITGSTITSDLLDQTLPASVNGVEIRARALVYREDTAANPHLMLRLGAGAAGLEEATDLGWNKLELDILADNGTEIGLYHPGGISTETLYVDGIGCWVLVDASGNSPGGTVEGAEALFEYDSVRDTFAGLWDTLVGELLTCRASPVREGSRLRFKYEAPRAPVALVTMGNTVSSGDESSFTVRYVNEKQRTNSVAIDFLDRAMRWERSTASVDDEALETTTDEGLVRRENYFLGGVTRRSQVLRHALFHLAVNRTVIREGSVTVDPTGLTYEPGDVISLGHDIVPWGQGGRLIRSAGIGSNVVENSQRFDLWTAPTGEVEITTDSMSTPDGYPVADLVEVLAAAQTSLTQTVTDITDTVSYCFSVRVKALAPGDQFGILLNQIGGAGFILAEYDWTTGVFSEPSSGTGWTLTLIEEADGWVRLGVEIQSASTDDIIMSILPARGSVFTGVKVWLADAQIESGASVPTDYDRPGLGFFIDREVTLAAGSTYKCRIVSQTTGATEEAEITSGPGVYEEGDRIEFLATSLTFRPQEGDAYLIYTDAEKMLASVTAVRINEDLSCEVDWVQYDESIFDGDDLSDSQLFAETYVPGSDDSNEADPNHPTIIPASAERVTLLETGTVGQSGMPQPILDVGWQPPGAGARDVAEYRLYASFLDTDTRTWTQPRQLGVATGSATSAQIPLPQSVAGRLCHVMVQPVTQAGARRSPRDCDGQVIELGRYFPQPEAPTNFRAHMEGDKIIFDWTAPESNAGLIYEIRHGGPSPNGGWVLAQKVGETRDVRLGPTEWWATAGQAGVTYYLRARNRYGVYSEAVTLAYGARVLNAELLGSSSHWFSLVTQDWHSYADGWVTDSVPPTYDPSLTNLERHADGYLTFVAGTDLTGTYSTGSIPTGEEPPTFQREELLRIEAVLKATCRNPTPVGESNINADGTLQQEVEAREVQVGSPFNGNVTAEGFLQGDLPTIKVQMRLIRDDRTSPGATPAISADTDSDGVTGWIDYAPGYYPCHGAQFRVRVTRPTDDWEIRIHEFSVGCYRQLETRHYRTPAEKMRARRLGIG